MEFRRRIYSVLFYFLAIGLLLVSGQVFDYLGEFPEYKAGTLIPFMIMLSIQALSFYFFLKAEKLRKHENAMVQQ